MVVDGKYSLNYYVMVPLMAAVLIGRVERRRGIFCFCSLKVVAQEIGGKQTGDDRRSIWHQRSATALP